MRLHRRNADRWSRHDRAEDCYDYHYSEAELKQFTETVSAASRLVKKLYLYMNNHFAAKAVANAVVIKHQLGFPARGEYPSAFIERYPEVATIVSLANASTLLENATSVRGGSYRVSARPG